MTEQPSFLRGTFVWSVLGYAFAEDPPVDLMSDTVLGATNPWLVVAAVFERCRRGQHADIPRLARLFAPPLPSGAERAAVQLVGDAGREGDLDVLGAALLKGSNELRSHAARAASMSGRLSLVPDMVEAWRRVESRQHHESIGNALSLLLEATPGDIAVFAGSHAIEEGAPPGESDFERAVALRLATVRRAFDERLSFWRGRPFEVQDVLARMLSLVTEREAGSLHGNFLPMRQKFESATGISLAGCYERGVLRPLNAAALLEGLVSGGEGARYTPGLRYFFGHRIPE